MGRDPIAFLQDLRAHGDIVTFYLGPRPVHQINSPALIKQVLVTDAHKFERGKIFTKARQLFGDGLATSDEPTHMRQRRVMQPAFHADRITAYVRVMRSEIEKIVSSWRAGQQVMLDREMANLTLRVTAKALFSAELGRSAVTEVSRSLGPVLNGLMKRTMMPVEMLERIPTPANRRFDAALHRLMTVVDEVIAAYRASDADHGDLLSMLVAARHEDSGRPLSSAEIRTQVMNILMAGTDTTATTLSWVFYEVTRNPDVRAEIDAELRSVHNGHSGLPDFPYVNRVLNETIRLHTPIWLVTRKATAPVRLGGVLLEPGAEVMISMPTLHRDPALFAGPMRFDPDRWLDPAAKDWPRASFIPFGAGAHKCIGDRFAWTEMTIAVAEVCARWRLTLPAGYEVREVARAFLRPGALPMTPVPA